MQYQTGIVVCINASSDNNLYTHSLNTNQWYHLCTTFDGTIVRLYIDGIEVWNKTASIGSYKGAASTLFIGGTNNYYFKGYMNDVRYYDHALSPKEVKEIAQGLVAHYPLNNNGQGDDEDYTDTVEYDVSGNGYNGVKNGITYESDTPKYSVSSKFNGSNTRIALSDMYLGNEWSYGMWVKAPESTTRGWENLVMLNETGSDSDTQLSLWLNLKANGLQSTANKQYNSTIPYPNDGSWHHVFATFDGSSLKTYIDGLLINTKSITNAWFQRTHLTIGAVRTGDNTYTSYSICNMSDFRLYSTTLSADDIKELYETSASIDNNGNMFAYEFSEPSNNELLAVPYTNSVYVSDPTAEYTIRNADGEYYYEGNSSSGSEYIKINPTGKTYYYDTMVSVSAGNQFYIGFERYDANKTARSNQACVYIAAPKPSSDLVRYRYRGTIDLSTDGVNPCDTIRIRILNGWTGSDSSSTKKATVHYLSLREVTTPETTSISKQGITKTDMLLESDLKDIEKNGTINMKQFIER